MRILSPRPYRVYQRGFAAKIAVSSEKPLTECDIILVDTVSGDTAAKICSVPMTGENGIYTADADLPAGGWYRLTVISDGETAAAEPVGVGDVFVIAGQSHATNSNSRQFRVTEPEGRITVYDPKDGSWRTAHDRQPCYDLSDYNADFGSLWPVTFDALFGKTHVPVGMTNAAYGATALFQWMPGHETGLFENLVTCCRAAENFRAILWQQGESDVMWHTETDDYVSGMLKLRDALDKRLGFRTEWIVAKSTIHPSAYNDPEHEKKIRDADDILWHTDGFVPGPDTDTLTGDCRDVRMNSGGHFTEKGQLLAGAMWADVLCGYIKMKGE